MKISDIKKWAKEQGYNIVKKEDDSINGATYYWNKIDNIEVKGQSISVSKVAKDVYNHITNNRWTEHQQNYTEKKSNEHSKIDINN